MEVLRRGWKRRDLQLEGGLDISASLVAAALHADLYENWTDVSGILMADPGIVRNLFTVPVMTYGDLKGNSYLRCYGHAPSVVEPSCQTGNFNYQEHDEPDATGTLVVKDKKVLQRKHGSGPFQESVACSGKAGKTGLNDITKLCKASWTFFTTKTLM